MDNRQGEKGLQRTTIRHVPIEAASTLAEARESARASHHGGHVNRNKNSEWPCLRGAFKPEKARLSPREVEAGQRHNVPRSGQPCRMADRWQVPAVVKNSHGHCPRSSFPALRRLVCSTVVGIENAPATPRPVSGSPGKKRCQRPACQSHEPFSARPSRNRTPTSRSAVSPIMPHLSEHDDQIQRNLARAATRC